MDADEPRSCVDLIGDLISLPSFAAILQDAFLIGLYLVYHIQVGKSICKLEIRTEFVA
jgi:hypothetical protein